MMIIKLFNGDELVIHIEFHIAFIIALQMWVFLIVITLGVVLMQQVCKGFI